MSKDNEFHPSKDSLEAAARLREKAGQVVDNRLAELRELIENKEITAHELYALRKGLEALRAHSNSPEQLSGYCRDYLLGLNTAVLSEQGYSLNNKPELDRKSKKRAGKIREIIDKLLADDGTLQATEVETVVKIPHRAELLLDEADAGLLTSLDSLEIDEPIKESFLVRAAEARRQSEVEIRGLLPPQERLKKELLKLLDLLKEAAVESLLNIEGTHPNLKFANKYDVGQMTAIAESIMAKIIQSEEFREIARGIEQTAAAGFEEFANSTPAKQIAATIATAIGVVAVGKGLITIGDSGIIGGYLAACWTTFIAGTIGAPIIKRYGEDVFNHVRDSLDQLTKTLGEAEKKQNLEGVSLNNGATRAASAGINEEEIGSEAARRAEILRRTNAAQTIPK